ncbi:hypothetical protein [Acinetobacter sp. BSP-28]|uniref:hypothetical protein n=1 Tax=Acinetobacter sp. BSP-28 TaxID=3344661 RepID=UPI0037705473
MNVIDAFLAPFYKWIILALLVFILGYAWYANGLAGDLHTAQSHCDARVEKVLKPYKDAEKAAQANANKVSEQHEEAKKAERVRTEIINTKVEKIVERPVYSDVCFDADGMSVVNEAATSGIPDSS